MKEATGELNMTVITVVAIAAVAAFFYAVVWPSIQSSIEQGTRCADAICQCTEGATTCPCQYYDADAGSYQSITCANRADND